MTTPKAPRFISTREPILSKEAIAYGRQMASNPKSATQFLKDIGLLTKSGKLSRHYYPNGS